MDLTAAEVRGDVTAAEHTVVEGLDALSAASPRFWVGRPPPQPQGHSTNEAEFFSAEALLHSIESGAIALIRGR